MKTKHENNIVRYAQDCLRHKDPWTKWFYQYDGNDGILVKVLLPGIMI